MKKLVVAAERLRDELTSLKFGAPVTHVYNPLDYAWELHRQYLQHAQSTCRVLFLGMNPGPWGMAQSGVPFGEIEVVKHWMQINGSVSRPLDEHPKRPIEGLDCKKSEVSGRRLWGLMRERFGTPSGFFAEHFVVNYCPLVFMESSGKNHTPDKLPASEREPMQLICDEHLRATIVALNCKHLVGVGAFAEECLRRVCKEHSLNGIVSRILHPSPASPASNRDWAGEATRQLKTSGVWSE